LQRILKPLKNYDSVLLACTHYPAIETEFMSTGSPEQLELFRYNSKKVFDVYISKVYPIVQDEMDFTF